MQREQDRRPVEQFAPGGGDLVHRERFSLRHQKKKTAARMTAKMMELVLRPTPSLLTSVSASSVPTTLISTTTVQ
jgi:hypothetical protein